ncbi:MAG: SLC13/DASS family transporter [Nitrospirae bacterium]|nr:SLC13/DASS family transporter [Nitrospirota bacterium]
MAEKEIKRTEGLPPPPEEIAVAVPKVEIDWKRILTILIGLAIFLVIFYSPSWPDAVDPQGKHFPLSKEGKAAIGLFLMVGTWWLFEVVPIGIGAISIGVFQALFAIRSANDAFRDFFDPAVFFIFGSLVIGLAFTKTGLTKRLAYKMLSIVGERTNMMLLGTCLITASLTLVMAHTAAAATVFPLLMAIYALYGEGEKPTNFGKALFIGMAWSAGTGSIISMLGSARAPAAAGMFKEFTGKEIGFFDLPRYMILVSIIMLFVIWAYLMVVLKPEKKTIPGIKEKVKALSKELGPMTWQEKFVIGAVVLIVGLMGLQAFVPALKGIDRSAIMLLGTLLFFFFKVLTIKELEDMPWNIILLFGGAMSIGFCLWKTGGAQWLAIEWLAMFKEAHWLVFVCSVAFFVLAMTNFIMNVAAIALSLPISLVIASYLGVAPEVIVYSSLVAAGQPMFLLIGQAPNVIAYGSGQFSSGEFFKYGIPPSFILMFILAAVIYFLWPIVGMPVLVK